MGNRRRGRGDAGDATVEAVLAVPVLMLLILMIIQFGLWYQGAHVAEAAAQEGVRAARVDGGTASAGQERATQFMAQAAPTLVEGVSVTSSRDAATATVVVSGRVQAIVPGLNLVSMPGRPVRWSGSRPIRHDRSRPVRIEAPPPSSWLS